MKNLPVNSWPALGALGALGVLTVLAAPASAQVDLERFERQLEQIQRETRLRVDTAVPADQRALLDYGAFATFNFLAIDDPEQETHILRQTDLNAYVRLNFDGVHEFFLRGRTSYLDFNTGDAFDDHGDDWIEPQIERVHYRFDLQQYLAAYEGEASPFNFTIQGGRQLVNWVNGLTLSQEIDGAVLGFSYDPVALDLVFGRTRPSTVDIDSSRPDFDGDTQRDFYGAMLSVQVTPEHRPYIYGLIQEDSNDSDFTADALARARAEDPTIPSTPLFPTRFEYDTHYIGFGSSGNIGDQVLYAVEIVYQGGEGLSTSLAVDAAGNAVPVGQTDEDIEAWALDVKFDYLFHDPNRSRAVVELVLASGDDDRLHTTNTVGGNRSGTDDNAFNAFGLINTGLAFAPNVSNLGMVRGGLSTFPLPNSALFKRLQVGTNLFIFAKLDSDSAFDEATGDTNYLGFETDVYANWQITSDLSLAVRYGVFFPGSAIRTDHDARHFLFTGVTLAF